ncbi:MAG: ABC transporter substrate-binding protein [Rhodospirillales bacterium]|nr:ABC transporter substrate-binding protein [Rhodospirillales bacterium]
MSSFISRTCRTAFLALVIAVSGATWAGTAAFANTEEAGEFLMSLNREARTQFDDPALDEGQKEQRFRELAERSFDVPKISKFVLGVNWRRATEEQRNAFLQIFKEVNTQRFLPMFSEYRNQEFRVTKVRQDEKNEDVYFVSSTITRAEGAPIKVEWRIYRGSDSFHILDVVAEGVSMVLTLRKEYATVINNDGIDGLIAQLREKVRSGTTEPVITTTAQ